MSNLILHCGAGEISRDQLNKIDAPQGTNTWFPVKHGELLDAVETNLQSADYKIAKARLGVGHEGLTFFGVLDIESEIVEGVSLSVGVRNSNNKRFPMGMVCGHRVFCCDNLAFSGEVTISKRHTKFGEDRYREGISHAVHQLSTFKMQEAVRIQTLKAKTLKEEQAESIILRSYESGLVGARMLPKLITEWRNPSQDVYQERTGWSLLNCYTEVVKPRFERCPQKAAYEMMQFYALCS